ncbi:MAG TPA: hypothetical protein V6C78_30885 [Crinalium sp.]
MRKAIATLTLFAATMLLANLSANAVAQSTRGARSLDGLQERSVQETNATTPAVSPVPVNDVADQQGLIRVEPITDLDDDLNVVLQSEEGDAQGNAVLQEGLRGEDRIQVQVRTND